MSMTKEEFDLKCERVEGWNHRVNWEKLNDYGIMLSFDVGEENKISMSIAIDNYSMNFEEYKEFKEKLRVAESIIKEAMSYYEEDFN